MAGSGRARGKNAGAVLRFRIRGTGRRNYRPVPDVPENQRDGCSATETVEHTYKWTYVDDNTCKAFANAARKPRRPIMTRGKATAIIIPIAKNAVAITAPRLSMICTMK